MSVNHEIGCLFSHAIVESRNENPVGADMFCHGIWVQPSNEGRGGASRMFFFFMFGFCPGGALNPSIASTLCIGAFVAPVARLQVFGGGDL